MVATTTLHLMRGHRPRAFPPRLPVRHCRFTVGQSRSSVSARPPAPPSSPASWPRPEHGCGAGVTELSAHALSLHRVDGIVFDVAAFTNSHDHLDYYGDMEHYCRQGPAVLLPRALSRWRRVRRRRQSALAKAARTGDNCAVLDERKRRLAGPVTSRQIIHYSIGLTPPTGTGHRVGCNAYPG